MTINTIRRFLGLPELATCDVDRCAMKGLCNRRAVAKWHHLGFCKKHYDRMVAVDEKRVEAYKYMETLK